jgi:iron complex outermembrane receptor protein
MKYRLLLGTTALTISFSLLPAIAHAQDANETVSFDDIVVTAQKREASLQDTPIAISAFSGDTLSERGINNAATLQSYVPNLNVGAELDGVKISLRGIGTQSTTSLGDSGVAFYTDNFYVGRPAGGSATFFDIDRIEVLRGPQGMLYGRNATGGVINVISNAPKHDLEAQIGASYGSRDMFELRGVLNLPLTDIAAFRVAATYSREDGYVKNLSTEPGTKDGFGSDGDISVRGQLLVGDKEEIEILLYGNYSKQNGTGTTMTFLERNPGGPPPVQALIATIPSPNPNPLIANNNAPQYNDIETTTTFARLTKGFGGAEAVLQFGKMWQSSDMLQDFDSSPVDISRFNKYQESSATSVEARLASTGSGPLSWIIGGYYFRESVYIRRHATLNGLTPGGIIAFPIFLLDEEGVSTTKAAFGSATYEFVPGFRLTAGLRYTDDRKLGTKTTFSNFGQPFPLDIPNAFFPGKSAFNKMNWKVGVEWEAAPSVLVYGSVSTGYKAGGFNVSSDASPYDAENITAYEFGVKSDLFDRRLRLNIDSFYYDYTDMQLTTIGTFPGSNTPGQFTTNAGKSRIYGVEVDSRFRITPDLSIMASYAYTDAKLTELTNIDPRDNISRNLAGNAIPYVSRHVLNVGLHYENQIDKIGTFSLAANHNWHARRWLREFNDPIVDLVPANGKTDITVTFKPENTNLSITGYVTNIENDIEKTNIFLTPGFIGTNTTTTFTKPRTFGLKVDYKF